METQHPEDDNISPFIIHRDTATSAINEVVTHDKQQSSGNHEAEDEDFVSCPVEGCGEQILLTDLENHVEMHGEEGDFSSSATPEPDTERPRTQRPATRGKRVKLSPEFQEKSPEGSFGTKLSYALRNLEDVDVEVHEREERSGRNAQRKGNAGGGGSAQSTKSAWGKILKMPEINGTKGGTRRRSRSPARNATASPKKAAVKRLGVSPRALRRLTCEGKEMLICA